VLNKQKFGGHQDQQTAGHLHYKTSRQDFLDFICSNSTAASTETAALSVRKIGFVSIYAPA